MSESRTPPAGGPTRRQALAIAAAVAAAVTVPVLPAAHGNDEFRPEDTYPFFSDDPPAGVQAVP